MRLVLYSPFHSPISSIFQLFSPFDEILVLCSRKQKLQPLNSIVTPYLNSLNEKDLLQFLDLTEPGDVVFLSYISFDWNHLIHEIQTQKQIQIYGYYSSIPPADLIHRNKSTSDFFDYFVVFPTMKQLNAISEKLKSDPKLLQLYKTWSKFGYRSFVNGFFDLESNAKKIPEFLKNNTPFPPNDQNEYYHLFPVSKFKLTSTPTLDIKQFFQQIDKGPPYICPRLSVNKFPITHLSRKSNNSVSALLIIKQAAVNNGYLSLNLGPSIFALMPLLFHSPYKLSIKLCIRLCFDFCSFFEFHGDVNNQFYSLVIKYLKQFKKVSFQRFQGNLIQLQKTMNSLQIPQSRQKTIIIARGYRKNPNFNIHIGSRETYFYPLNLSTWPHEELQSWLFHPKCKKVPPALDHLISKYSLDRESTLKSWRAKLTNVISKGLLHEYACSCPCKLESFKLNKLCNSDECESYFYGNSCVIKLISLNILDFAPGKKMCISSYQQLLCPICKIGNVLRCWKMPIVHPQWFDHLENHEIWWCKICQKAKLIQKDKIANNLVQLLNKDKTSFYFVCDDDHCQKMAHYSTCPFCHYQIFRLDGCNDMTCRCGEKFCFNCLRVPDFCKADTGYPCSKHKHTNPLISQKK